jgi:hypothetical protein
MALVYLEEEERGGYLASLSRPVHKHPEFWNNTVSSKA